MDSRSLAAIKEHLVPYDVRQPFARRRLPGALILSGCHRPHLTALRALLAERFTVAVADLHDARWRESNLLFCYQLARCLVESVRQVDADAQPIAPKKDLFAGRPFSTLSLTLEEIEQDAQRRQRYVFLILDNYDQLDEGLKTRRLSAEVLNQLRHIIQHRQYITVLLSGRQRPEELSGAPWMDYLIDVRMVETGA